VNARIEQLRLRLCPESAFPAKDRVEHVTAPITGVLLGHVWTEDVIGDQIISSPLSASDAKALGLDAKSAIQVALRNVASRTVGKLDVMRISNETRLFMFNDDEPALAGRLLGVESLVNAHLGKLSPAVQKHAKLGANGALVGAPFQGLLMVLSIDGNNFLEGAINLAANVRANHDPDADDALSPWVYWVRGDHIEEMQYDVEDDEVSSINFPDALLPLLA